MFCTVGRCRTQIISKGFRRYDILKSHSFDAITSLQHPAAQFGKTLKWKTLSTGTFGQSESWGVHISSSWKHPAVPYEVLIDPLSMPDQDILNANTRLSAAIHPDKPGARRGEAQVSCINLTMISLCKLELCVSPSNKR